MSDIHVKYLLARIAMSGSAIAVRGEEGPRNQWAPLADKARAKPTCPSCGGMYYDQCDLPSGICAVRAIEMRKAKR